MCEEVPATCIAQRSHSCIEPTSWAQDLNTYRQNRGSLAYATVRQPATTIGRTHRCPLGATRHPQFTVEHELPAVADAVTKYRWDRHGWGETALLKEVGGEPPSAAAAGRRRPPASAPSLHSDQDAWIGNKLIHPAKGKLAVHPPPDPKGRKDLFQVLNMSSPATMADDSWLGNIYCDPAKGKKDVPGPEMIQGRADLFKIIQQEAILNSSSASGSPAGLLKKGDQRDPLADAWLGHRLIDPTKGKRAISDTAATQQNMWGASFKDPVPNEWTDFGRLGKKTVPLELLPTIARSGMLACMQRSGQDSSSGGQSFWWKRTRRLIPEPRPPVQEGAHTDIYSTMTYMPVDEVEAQVHARSNVTGLARKRTFTSKPGDDHPCKGADMLRWKPGVGLEPYHYGKRMLHPNALNPTPQPCTA